MIDPEELRRWWLEQAGDEAEGAIAKADEYGAGDLRDLGQAMARLTEREGLTDAEAMELGVFFYLRGKIARWASAIEERRTVSDDTIKDILVYARMVQRIRFLGGWPR